MDAMPELSALSDPDVAARAESLRHEMLALPQASPRRVALFITWQHCICELRRRGAEAAGAEDADTAPW